MRVLCLTDFNVPEGQRWLWDYIPNQNDEITFLSAQVEDRYQAWGKVLRYYPALFGLAHKALRKLNEEKYDVIIAWEGKNGFPLALLRQITGNKGTPLVILAFSVRGPLKAMRWLQHYGIEGMDYATVPTLYEKEYYSSKLDIAKERIFHCPIGTHDLFINTTECLPGEMIFSGGRSGRDYATFFKAVEGLPCKVIVNARPFNLRNLKAPDNTQVNDLMPWYEYSRLYKQSRFTVVPLAKVDEAVGLTAILDGMAAGRAVIASDVPGSCEYVKQGETGILVPAGEAAAMREAIIYLWERPELCEEMGRRARQIYEEMYTFPLFAQRVYGIVKAIVGESGKRTGITTLRSD